MSSIASTAVPLIKNTTNSIKNLCQYRNYAIETTNFLECFLFKLPFFLQDIGIGYICVVLCTVVIVTSILGKIKESYKWFILNQAIWNLFVSYDYICARPKMSYFLVMFARIGENIWTEIENDDIIPNCFYSSEIKFTRFTNAIINKEAGYMLFLLSFSRFLALYFHHFYDRNFGTDLKTIFAISIFDLFFILSVNLKSTYLAIFTWGDTKSLLLSAPEYILMLLIIPSSLIFTILVLAKIFQQLKFQSQQQHSNTQQYANIRIAGVLFFQCITLILLFAFTSVYDFPYNIIPEFRTIITGLPLKVTLPPQFIQVFKNDQKCMNVIRVFIDSIVVLVVLSGYRKSILNIFKNVFLRWKKTSVESSTAAATIRNAAANGSRHR